MASKAKHIKAAEKALGIEPIGSETHAEAELRRKWERRFAPLGLVLREEYPPEDMWYRVQAALDRADDRRVIAKTKRSVWRWRFGTILAGLCAAGLAAFIVTTESEAPDRGTPAGGASQYVAVITPEDSKTAIIVEVDIEAGTALVRPVGVTGRDGKSLQIWTAPPDGDAVPVGLLDPGSTDSFEVRADPGDAFAISVEPEGGSPTGSPTGEVIYHGTLIAVPD